MVSTKIDNTVKCVYCNGSDVNISWSLRNEFGLASCNTCQAKFSWPRPTPSELATYYNSLSSIRYEQQTAAKSAKDALQLVETIKKFHPTARKVLEVGCSTAYYLHGLLQHGYDVMGSELSAEAAALAEKWYGVKVFPNEFPPDDYFNEFDVVIIHHVIEHVPFPVEFYEKAKQFLKKGGVLLIETPNYDSIGIRIFGPKYPVLCPPGHLNFFRKSTVRGMLKGDDKLLHLETTSAANYTIYNIIIATISVLNLKSWFKKMFSKRKQKRDDQGNTFQYNTEFTYTKKLLKISFALHFLFTPLFYLIDKLGRGENLNFVIQINDED